MKIRLIVLEQSICDNEGSRTTDAQLAMNENLFASFNPLVNEFAEWVKIIQDLRIVIPSDV